MKQKVPPAFAMTEQPAAIEGTTEGRLRTLRGRLVAWRFRLLLVLTVFGAGLLSVALGPDDYWDLRYYHLYAPWAYLHHRYLYDLGPAQEQGYLNPVADFLLYGLVSSPLNESPRIIAFIMGAVHGINAALVLAIAAHVIRPAQAATRMTLTAAAWLMGVSGAGFISLLGTCSNDLTSGLFVLASLLGVLKFAQPTGTGSGNSRLSFAAAGLVGGIGIGLKMTSAIYAPGLGVAAIIAALGRRSIAGFAAYVAAAAFGSFAVAGHHMLTLWNDFRNPFFPYLNQIFRSPWFDPIAIRDARFLPQSVWDVFTYPFLWTTVDIYRIVEPPFRDWRAAIAYVALVAGVLALAVKFLCNRPSAHKALAETPGLGIVLAFVVVSYVVWVLGFAYYRYAVPIEMLTGVVTMGALVWLFDSDRVRMVGAVVLLAIAGATTVYLDWGRRPYENRYVDVQVPPIPENAVVLVATWGPAGFFIPYAEPRARYVGMENNFLSLTQDNRRAIADESGLDPNSLPNFPDNKLALEVKRVMRTPGPPKFVLNVDAFDAGKLDALLAHFDLKWDGKPCPPIRTNLTGPALSLCRAVER
jgi:hypothetical protein